MGSLREAARDRDWPGGLGLAHSKARLGRVSGLGLSRSAAALAQAVGLTRARGAPPVSYGVTARGRSRSRLARGAWSRSLQGSARWSFGFGFIEISRRVYPVSYTH